MLSRQKTRSMAKRNECNLLTRHGEFLKKIRKCVVKLKEEVTIIALIICKIGILFDVKYIW